MVSCWSVKLTHICVTRPQWIRVILPTNKLNIHCYRMLLNMHPFVFEHFQWNGTNHQAWREKYFGKIMLLISCMNKFNEYTNHVPNYFELCFELSSARRLTWQRQTDGRTNRKPYALAFSGQAHRKKPLYIVFERIKKMWYKSYVDFSFQYL